LFSYLFTLFSISEIWDIISIILDSSTLFIPNSFEINSIKCWEYWEDKINYDEMTNTWTVEFKWININFNINSDPNCDLNTDRILEINIRNKVENKIITINTLNWLVNITK